MTGTWTLLQGDHRILVFQASSSFSRPGVSLFFFHVFYTCDSGPRVEKNLAREITIFGFDTIFVGLICPSIFTICHNFFTEKPCRAKNVLRILGTILVKDEAPQKFSEKILQVARELEN